MTLRLFLIGLVASVGLGLPAWPTIEGFADSVQTWTNSQLAALDSRAERGKNYVVIRDLLTEEMQRIQAARLARRSTPAPLRLEPRVQLVSMAHTISAEDITRAALARVGAPFNPPNLNLADHRIPAPVIPALAPAPALAPIIPVPVASTVRPDELASLAWNHLRPIGERFAHDLAEGLKVAAARDREARAFTAMEASNDLYFDGSFTLEASVDPVPPPAAVVAAVEPPSETPAPPAAPAAFAPLPGFEDLDPSVEVEDVAVADDDLPPALEAFPESTMSYAEAVAVMGELPDDVFAPLADAPIEPVVAQQTPAAPVAAHDVNRAVRLTREALSAWVNVLTGPALVTVSRTSPVR